jgi:ribosomal protein S18
MRRRKRQQQQQKNTKTYFERKSRKVCGDVTFCLYMDYKRPSFLSRKCNKRGGFIVLNMKNMNG